MSLVIEQLRPLNDRLESALEWLEARKAQTVRRLPRTEYDELTKIYWLLRDIRVGLRDTTERWRANAALLRIRGDHLGADSQEFCANELESMIVK